MSLLTELPMVNTKPSPSFHTPSASDHKIGRRIDQAWLRQVCLEAGADDVGFVEIDRPDLEKDRQDMLNAFPHTKTLISFVVRMNREPIRSPARSVANLEFHHTGTRSMMSLELLSSYSKHAEFEHLIPLWAFLWKWIAFQARFGWFPIKQLPWPQD